MQSQIDRASEAKRVKSLYVLQFN